MVIQTNYVLKFINVGNESVMCTFKFKSLLEVKNFVNKISDPQGFWASEDDYTLKLYKEVIDWQLEYGLFNRTETQITADW